MSVKDVWVGASTCDSRERFERLYGELYGPICGYVMRRAQDREDAAEVIAETFTTLWRRLDSCPADEDLRPWLFGVARRVLANQRRGERRRSALAERLVAEGDATPGSLFAAGSDSRIARAFAALSEPDREVLSLLAWEGLSRAELAAVLEVSGAVLRLRLHRARRRFAAALEREAQTPPVASPAASRLFEGGEEH